MLLDLNLHCKNGTEVLAEMRADPLLRAIPVAVLTTTKAEPDALHSYELGVNCFVTKPVGLTAFLEVIEAIQDFWLAVVRLPSRDDAWRARSRTAPSA